MSHIVCDLTCLLQNKAYCKTHCWSWFKGWSAVFSPLERYSWRALYRSCNSCIEEDNFDCKLQALTDLLIALWSVGSRCSLSSPVFVCSVIVVCPYLCTCLWSLCRWRFLRCAKRCHSCKSCCRRLLLRSRWILIGVLQRSLRWKIFAGEDFQPLVVLAVLCHLHGKLLVIHRS